MIFLCHRNTKNTKSKTKRVYIHVLTIGRQLKTISLTVIASCFYHSL